jgi:phosphoserine aminotransferase
MLTMEWMKRIGGIAEIAKRNAAKSELIYSMPLTACPIFKGTTAVEDRSEMNPTFVMPTQRWSPLSMRCGKKPNISGIRGHRSVGGYRASMYNALPLESVQASWM